MHTFIRSALTYCAIWALILGGAAQAGEMQQQLTKESAIEQIVQRGVMRVGMDVFVPWAMKDKKGELIGFEIDVAKKLASDLGVKVEFTPTEWSGIIPSLLAGKFDLIIGGMTVTAERNIKINFTNPYYFTGQAVLANKKMTENMSLDQLNTPEIALAARLGSTAALAAKQRFPKATIRLFDNEAAAVQEVKNGRVHAMVAGQPLPAQSAGASPDTLRAFDEVLMKEPIAMGLRKGDLDSLNFLNNWIGALEKSGWIKERFSYWFESNEWQSLVK